MLVQELVLGGNAGQNSMLLHFGGDLYEVRQGIEEMRGMCSSWEWNRALFWED